MYDAIIVGARCAGSPTAMLLARNGYRILLVDNMQELFSALRGNQEATNRFFSAITGSSPLPAFMSPENLERIMVHRTQAHHPDAAFPFAHHALDRLRQCRRW